MKRTTVLITTLLALTLSACKKEKIVISEKDLTGCPTNATCEALFTEQADISESGTQKSGSYRLFWSRESGAGMYTLVYFKAPMAGNSFQLTGADIRAGKADWFIYCPACMVIPFKPVDGYVKGVNSTPEKPADQSKWLVEAKIFMAVEGNPSLKDTIYLKKYFTANFVIN